MPRCSLDICLQVHGQAHLQHQNAVCTYGNRQASWASGGSAADFSIHHFKASPRVACFRTFAASVTSKNPSKDAMLKVAEAAAVHKYKSFSSSSHQVPEDPLILLFQLQQCFRCLNASPSVLNVALHCKPACHRMPEHAGAEHCKAVSRSLHSPG